MDFFYAFFIAFTMIFVSELGDKTQLIVLSFCNRLKTSSILFGVALGTLFSHGLAILFGSKLGLLNNDFRFYLSILTYISFIIFGVLGFWQMYKSKHSVNFCHGSSTINNNIFKSHPQKGISGLISTFKNKVSYFKFYYIFIIAFSIFIGELGDKTFLTSLGLGIQYPFSRIPLVLGSISGMVLSNSFAILFGKFLGNHVKQEYINILSNLIFIIFGTIGLFRLFCL